MIDGLEEVTMLLGEPRPEISVSTENYLQAIYKLEEREQRVSITRLAEAMDVSTATSLGTVKRLTRQELVAINSNKEIAMTDRGLSIAKSVVRRHRLAERLLTEVLGVEWYRAHEEAHRFEHAISGYVETKIASLLKNPTTCPWGHPIPDSGFISPQLTSLSQSSSGETLTINRVPEEDINLLEFFDKNGIRPGTLIQTKELAHFKGTITLTIKPMTPDEQELTIGVDVATQILVQRGNGARA
jgi:DtxR family Mn-dependent transcriptional regulator